MTQHTTVKIFLWNQACGTFLHKRECTWIAAMPTKELTVSLNVSSLESIRRSNSWTPYGLRSVSDRMIDSRKQSTVIRSRPICGHWVPIPANTNHTGRTSDDTFWTRHTQTYAVSDTNICCRRMFQCTLHISSAHHHTRVPIFTKLAYCTINTAEVKKFLQRKLNKTSLMNTCVSSWVHIHTGCSQIHTKICDCQNL